MIVDLTGILAKTLSYDLDGNLLSDGIFSNTWNVENMLTGASNGE